jgi:hypothetical protein
MSDFPHIYRPSLLQKLSYVIPLSAWGIGAIGLLVFGRDGHHDLKIGELIVISLAILLALLSIALAAFALTEEVEIDSHILVWRNIFIETKVPVKSVLEAKCVTFGRGNTCLQVRTRRRTFKMAYVFKTSDIEAMADEVVRFSSAGA